MPNTDYTPKARPGKKWYIVAWSPVRAVIEATRLASGTLPAKKIQDVQILYEAILARYQMPLQFDPENRKVLQSYREKLQQVKHFQL